MSRLLIGARAQKPPSGGFCRSGVGAVRGPPVDRDRPLRDSQTDTARADQRMQPVLYPVLHVGTRPGIRLWPQVQRRRRCPAELKRDQVVLFVIAEVRVAPVGVAS